MQVKPTTWGQVLAAIGGLSAVGGSVVMLVQALLTSESLASFWLKNDLKLESRWQWLLTILIGGAVPAVVALGALAIWPVTARARLVTVASMTAPLVVAGLIPTLFSARVWHDNPLTYLLLLTLTVVIFERALRQCLAQFSVVWRGVPVNGEVPWRDRISARQKRWLPLGLVVAGAIGYSVYFSYYTILNHHRLNTAGFDLGINVNWCYNALHGKWFRTTVLFGPSGGNMIAGHAIYAMLFLWLPFFAVWPTAETLLIYQASIAGLAAIPLYLFATTQTSRWTGVVVAFAFLFFAPLHGPNFYDFHELFPPLFFHFFLYYGIATRRNWLVFGCVFVLYACREDIPIGLTILGLYLIFINVRPRLGALLAACSVTWFVVDKFIIMPWVGNWWFASIYAELIPPGTNGYGAVVQTILINPAYFFSTLLREGKLIYALHLFAPLALLPLRRWRLAFLVCPGFFVTLMTTGYAPTLSIAFQYTCHWIPYLFAATLLSLRSLSNGPDGLVRRRAALGALVLGMASHSYVFGAVLQHDTFVGGFAKIEFHISDEERARYQELRRLAAMIPREASVAATENEVPHVAVRMEAYTLKDHGVEADYVLINRLRATGGTKHNIQTAMSHGTYGLLAHGDTFYLFKKNHESPDTAAARTALGL